MFLRQPGFFLLACAILCFTCIQAQNSVVNGGFEQGLLAWDASNRAPEATLDTDRSQAYQGSNSAVFGSADSTGSLQQVISLVAGQQYTFSFHFRPTVGLDDGWLISANLLPSDYSASPFTTYQAFYDNSKTFETTDRQDVSYTEYNFRSITATVQTTGQYKVDFFGNGFRLDAVLVNAGPVPSGAITKRKLLNFEARRQEILDARPHCPQGSRSCHITSSLTSGYECIDEQELTSCGGCVSEGSGQDCTLIPNSAGTGCQDNKCIVLSCAPGFAVTNNICLPSVRV